jgi:hypothetical protein
MSVLAWSPDGIINNIDYAVRDLSPTDNRIHFGDAVVPMIRIETGTVSTAPELPSAYIIRLSPNPASEEINITLEFPHTTEDIKIRVIDLQGKVVFEKEIKHIDDIHRENINARLFADGNYFIHVYTKDGQRIIPVAVVR